MGQNKEIYRLEYSFSSFLFQITKGGEAKAKLQRKGPPDAIREMK